MAKIRLVLALTAAMVLAISLPAQAEPIVHPAQGLPHFVVDPPSGWRASSMAGGTLKFEPTEPGGHFLLLFLLDVPEQVKDRSLSDIASQFFEASDYPPFVKRESASVDGRSGETFHSSIVDRRGGSTSLAITLVRLDELRVAALVTGFSSYSTQGEKDALRPSSIASGLSLPGSQRPWNRRTLAAKPRLAPIAD
jgi:hypothetical protein